MKPKILILYTGGTIGMRTSSHGFVPCAKFSKLLQEKIPEDACRQLPEFTVLELSQLIDSANLQPAQWTEMAELLITHWDSYDGFVVLHGTDTMDYTAAALSFMLQGVDKPIILTGSQVPLINLRSDGLENLITAMEIAGNCDVPEVCICFNNRLLRGNRSLKVNSSDFDAFESPNFPCLAKAGVRLNIEKKLLLTPKGKNFSAPKFNPLAVSVLHIYPGINSHIVSAILNNIELKGLIIRSYGAGNIPSFDQKLLNTLAHTGQRDVIIVNVTQCIEGAVSQGDYATGDILNRIGVISGGDITLAAIFAKLHYLFASGLNTDVIREKLKMSLCGEMS